jgi:hypothetical protein
MCSCISGDVIFVCAYGCVISITAICISGMNFILVRVTNFIFISNRTLLNVSKKHSGKKLEQDVKYTVGYILTP